MVPFLFLFLKNKMLQFLFLFHFNLKFRHFSISISVSAMSTLFNSIIILKNSENLRCISIWDMGTCLFGISKFWKLVFGKSDLGFRPIIILYSIAEVNQEQYWIPYKIYLILFLLQEHVKCLDYGYTTFWYYIFEIFRTPCKEVKAAPNTFRAKIV